MLVTTVVTRKRAIWALISTTLILTTAQPTANGLDFPTTTRLNLPEAPAASLTINQDVALNQAVPAPISEMAKVAAMTRQVELARTTTGAKYIARTIMANEYAWGDDQYSCLNRLWTRESHWNYKAHNYRSGAHGIAQALPASKMEIISTDWRTNPVTQIRWGLHYIDLRYETPCKAWAKFKRSRYY
jgi:hypothetical protein